MTGVVSVTPVYGWGWLNGDGRKRQTPSSFQVTGVPAFKWTAIVVAPRHEFDGSHVEIVQRGGSASVVASIVVTSADAAQCLATGYVFCGPGTRMDDT